MDPCSFLLEFCTQTTEDLICYDLKSRRKMRSSYPYRSREISHLEGVFAMPPPLPDDQGRSKQQHSAIVLPLQRAKTWAFVRNLHTSMHADRCSSVLRSLPLRCLRGGNGLMSPCPRWSISFRTAETVRQEMQRGGEPEGNPPERSSAEKALAGLEHG